MDFSYEIDGAPEEFSCLQPMNFSLISLLSLRPCPVHDPYSGGLCKDLGMWVKEKEVEQAALNGGENHKWSRILDKVSSSG